LTKEMSIAYVFKAFNARLKAIENVGCEAISDERKGHQFNAKLDLSRFSEIVNNVEKGIMPRPKNPQDAYEVTGGWRTARVKTGGAYAAQESKKKIKEPAADVKEKKTGERSTAGHHIPREAMTAFRERAIKMGIIPGEVRRNSGCPNL
jgi:hypothetical protein